MKIIGTIVICFTFISYKGSSAFRAIGNKFRFKASGISFPGIHTNYFWDDLWKKYS